MAATVDEANSIIEDKALAEEVSLLVLVKAMPVTFYNCLAAIGAYFGPKLQNSGRQRKKFSW